LWLKANPLVRKPTDEENVRGRWTKLDNEESHNIVRTITVRWVKWVGFVTRMVKRRAAKSFDQKA